MLRDQLFIEDIRGLKICVKEKSESEIGRVLFNAVIRPLMLASVLAHGYGGCTGEDGCPRCGSHNVQSRGYHKAISRVYRRWNCQACGGWFRSVVNEKDIKPKYRVI